MVISSRASVKEFLFLDLRYGPVSLFLMWKSWCTEGGESVIIDKPVHSTLLSPRSHSITITGSIMIET